MAQYLNIDSAITRLVWSGTPFTMPVTILSVHFCTKVIGQGSFTTVIRSIPLGPSVVGSVIKNLFQL